MRKNLLVLATCVLTFAVATVSITLKKSPDNVIGESGEQNTNVSDDSFYIDTADTNVIEKPDDESIGEINHSLLAKYYKGFGAIGKDANAFEQDEEQFAKEEIEREVFVQNCMESYGFTYTPLPSIEIDSSHSNEDIMDLLGSVNPNEEYHDRLSESEKSAYNMSLYGSESSDYMESVVFDEIMSGDSCVAQAFRKVDGVYDTVGKMRPEIDELENSIEQDSRLTKAVEEWSYCMSESGYMFSDKSSPRRQLDELYSQIYEEREISSDSAAMSLTPQLNEILTGALSSSNTETNMEMFELQIQEYVGDLDKVNSACDLAVDFDGVKNRVRNEHERAFIEAYSDILEPRDQL